MARRVDEPELAGLLLLVLLLVVGLRQLEGALRGGDQLLVLELGQAIQGHGALAHRVLPGLGVQVGDDDGLALEAPGAQLAGQGRMRAGARLFDLENAFDFDSDIQRQRSRAHR